MKETKSNWQCVADALKQECPVSLSSYTTRLFYNEPFRLFYRLAHYKFAAKMIGKQRSVLDFHAEEGIGTYLLSQECRSAHGILCSEEEKCIAQKNFQTPSLRFSLGMPADSDSFDAMVCLSSQKEMSELPLRCLREMGMLIIGIPMADSLKTLAQIKERFVYSFSFGVIGETISLSIKESPYQIIVACQKK